MLKIFFPRNENTLLRCQLIADLFQISRLKLQFTVYIHSQLGNIRMKYTLNMNEKLLY